MSKVLSKTQCPKCAEEGRDSKGDNLFVYADGGAYCHAGHGRIRMESEIPEKKAKVSSISISDCLSEAIGHDPNRKLSKDTIDKYGTRIVYDTIAGTPKKVHYPYFDSSGKVVGVKTRIVPTKDFYVVGKLAGFYGKQACHPHPKGALFITEGEEDCMALHEMLQGGPTANHDVVSIPNGAQVDGRIDPAVQGELDFIRKYSKVVLCLDNDEPGRATAKKLAGWLSGFIPDIRIVQVPLKDASNHLMAGDKESLFKAIKETPQYRPDGIIHGSEISISDIIRAVPEGYDTPFPGINDKLHGVRKGEILTICAGSGIGKSTLVKEIGYDLVVRHGLTVCHIALEDVVEATAASYIAMDRNVPSSKFRCDPSCIPLGDIEASMDRTVRRMYFFNHFGSIDTRAFREKIQYYARAGVDFIILDHLSMVISGSDVANERKEIDMAMTFLAEMVVSTGVGLINVVHLKRRESRDSGKSLNEGGAVSLTDLRGSAALEQLSWGVLALERNQQAEDGSEDFCSIRVLKNRTWGFTGKAGRVKYRHDTGRMVHVEEEIPESEPIALSTPEETVGEEPSSKELAEILKE